MNARLETAAPATVHVGVNEPGHHRRGAQITVSSTRR